ncbi:MAG: hypothetical protein AB7L90_22435 [Hyphomicrobiaceae bacterium]
MSALAHMIEGRGIPTTVVGLVRPHLEKARPPRSLFVPFQLGRPLGEPDDPAFQLRVLRHALGLLERTDGPVILEDFPDDPPGWSELAGWQPSVALHAGRPAAAADSETWTTAFRGELAHLAPYYQRAMARHGRTTVGLSRLPTEAWPDFAVAFLDGSLPAPPLGLPTSAIALRFLSDDIKAFYGEAVQADGPRPASRQIDQWFWRKTVAGALLQALRRVGMDSGNNALKTVSGRFFVPAPYVAK